MGDGTFPRSRSANENAEQEQGATRVAASEVLRIWLRYKRTGEVKLRDQLVFIFTPMVRYIVYRKVREVPAQCDVEDFLSCGLEALIRSIDRYDPEKGATLEQFAWTRIHGAVLDELRRHDWAPRSLRRSERAINGARERFLAANDRQPTREELAAAAEMEPAVLSRRLDDIALAEVASLNKTVRSEDATTIERIDTIESVDEDTDPELSASAAKPRNASVMPSPSCRRASVRLRCCCMWRTARCARSARDWA